MTALKTNPKHLADKSFRCLLLFQMALHKYGLLLVMTLCTLTVHAATTADEKIHRQALTQARAGNHEAALSTLQLLVTRHPEQPLYLFDYITVLGWAERDTEALDYLPQLDLDAAPIYTLEALGKSARNQKRFPLSIDIYRTAVRKNPRSIQSALGLALSMADNGDVDEASNLLVNLLLQYPSHIEIQNAQAYVFIKQKAFFKALKIYDQVLNTRPENREARRGRILITARLGAPHLAAAMAEQTPELLSPTELDAIYRDRIAITIRWGRLPGKDDRPSYSDTDQAIATLEGKLRQLQTTDAPNTRTAQKLRYDLIEALYDRQRYADVIAIYEEHITASEQIPNHALSAVAGAYLQLREPEKSLALLRRIKQKRSDDFDTRLTMVYAYVDNEEFEEAQDLISRMAQQEPPWQGGKDGIPLRENPNKLQADVTAALVQAFADNLGDAQSRLGGLLSNAPNNPGLRSELGYIYLWRGLPEHALREFNIAQYIQPEHLNARQGETAALLELAEFRSSHESLQQLEKQYPLNSGIRKLQRTWEIHNMRELRMTTGYGESSGVQEGSEDFNLDAWLFSQPLKYRYRPFLYTHFATAKFPEGNAEYRRVGAGLEYRQRKLELISTLTRDDDDNSVNAGLALSALWKPTDHWRLGTGYDSNSNDIPLRGRLNENVDGWLANLDISYYFHESRRIDTGLKYLDFSDGNTRKSAQATLFQRLITKPHYKLDGTVGAYSSSNTRDSTSYFNPDKDLSFDVTVINEWLQFRQYDRSFRHRLGFSLGSYYQESFGTKATGLIFYEQQWNPNDTFEISYGISRAHRAYDGTSENKTRLYLTSQIPR